MKRTVQRGRKTAGKKSRRPGRTPRAKRSGKVTRNRKQGRKPGRKAAKKSPKARTPLFAAVWARLGRELLRLLKKERGLDRKAIAAALAQDAEIRKLLAERVARLAAVPQPTGEARAYAIPIAAAPVLSEDDELANEYAMAASYAKVKAARQEEQAATDESANWRLF
jgi:hypothetical protein